MSSILLQSLARYPKSFHIRNLLLSICGGCYGYRKAPCNPSLSLGRRDIMTPLPSMVEGWFSHMDRHHTFKQKGRKH